MKKESNLIEVHCPGCGNKLLEKGKNASGPVQPKCFRCRRVWEVDLGTNKIKFISGKPIPRREGA